MQVVSNPENTVEKSPHIPLYFMQISVYFYSKIQIKLVSAFLSNFSLIIDITRLIPHFF